LTDNANPGTAGRLFYEAPVIQVMGRELSSFTDMQMTLKDLGYNSGSILLRLSFRPTEKPLEEAMLEIGQYFKDVEDTKTTSGSLTENTASSSSVVNAAENRGNSEEAMLLDRGAEEPYNGKTSETGSIREQSSNSEELDEPTDQPVVGPDQRPISIYAPSSNSTPQAATRKISLLSKT
jgi:tether containing UBX domain for GLUT4